MELHKFKDIFYGKLDGQLFIWDSSWEIFRPIEYLGWDGDTIIAVDTKYKSDLFCPWYGFGSSEMKELCQKLTETIELDVPESVPDLKGEWFRDREIQFASKCSPRTPLSWSKYIKYIGSRSKTLRKHNESRHTKRTIN
jgi:hypothetical protein